MKLAPGRFGSSKFLNQPISDKHFEDVLQQRKLSAAIRARLRLQSDSETSNQGPKDGGSRLVNNFVWQNAGKPIGPRTNYTGSVERDWSSPVASEDQADSIPKKEWW